MMMRTITLFLAAFTLFATSNVIAQSTGTITGTILDSSNNETLIGANIIIEGTSIGTATNLEGQFTLRNIQPGQYTLIITYIGYDEVRKDVVVESGQETNVEIVLNYSGIIGGEIVVSTQARGQMSAINEQLGSRSIQNVVSAERIRELPDANAAAALSRLPGVSLQQGDKIAVRGMQAKFNTVSVNGIQLPSTDKYDRSTNLGFISSNMLEAIDVTKASTPDMEANATGGAVNLRLREAPSGLKFDAMVEGSYNTLDHTYPGQNYRIWASVSDRFFNERLGVFIQGNAHRRDTGADIVDAGFGFHSEVNERHVFMVDDVTFEDQVNITSDYGGSVILDFRLPNGKISLQNTIANTNTDLVNHREVLDLGITRRSFRLNRDDRDRQLLINALQGESKISDLSINYGLHHSSSKYVTNLKYGGIFSEAFFASTTKEISDFPDQNRLEITFDEFFDIEFNEVDWLNASHGGTHSLLDDDFSQRNIGGNLDFTFPVTIAPAITAEFKTGGRVTVANRENDHDYAMGSGLNRPAVYESARIWAEERGIDPNKLLRFGDFMHQSYADGRGQYFFNGRRPMELVIDSRILDSFYSTMLGQWPIHETNSQREDFTAREQVTAGYAMGTFDVGRRFTLIAGVRYEHFSFDYDANFVYNTHSGWGDVVNIDAREPHVRAMADSLTNVKRGYGHFFPNVQARLEITDWMDVRAAYTRSILRPDFRMQMSNVTRGATSGQDAALPEEVSFPGPEVWEAMGFSVPESSYRVWTYMNNPHNAYVHGFEIDWQTIFWYLPKPFNTLVLNTNYTRNFSRMDYQLITFREERDLTVRPPRIELVEEETIREGRLLYQGDDIINVALGVDYKGFSGRVSYRFQGDVITNVGDRSEYDRFNENVSGWDFSLRQRLPIDGLSLSLSGVNITHNPTRTYRYFQRFEDGQLQENPTNQLNRVQYGARNFILGLRYDF
ncbi:MAG: TonB-dependent receptor [Rhodothermaceae bacterium]|nr:TonB-dependent receptor [Rhodothermaceae bacterium]